MKWKGKINFETTPQVDGVDISVTTHDHNSDYAPASEGVTNGDSHDHNGGDGAQISHDNLSDVSANDHHNRAHNMTGTSDHDAGNYKIFYSDGSGNVQELAHGTSDYVLTSNGASSAPSWQEAGGGVFGEATQDEESTGQSSHGNTDWVQKLRLTTGSVNAGRYRIGWYYEWAHSSNSYDFQAQVEVDDTTVVMDHGQEPQDPGSDQHHPASGFAYIDLSAATHTVDLDYRPEGGNGTAYIRNARLEIWRVS